jgi:hypothetical protein
MLGLDRQTRALGLPNGTRMVEVQVREQPSPHDFCRTGGCFGTADYQQRYG